MIFVLLIFLLFIITCGICVYAYRIAFMAPPKKDPKEYHLPVGEQYEVHYPVIQASIEEMLAKPYEEVSIHSFDDTKLYGRYYHYQDHAPIHLMMHGYKGNPYTDFCGGSKLAASFGHNLLVIDQRSHGNSEGKTITFGIKERKDCFCWIQYLSERFGSHTPIFLWGLSMGAATVLMTTDLLLPDNVVGILADCPYSAPKKIIKKVCTDMKLPANLFYPFIKLSAAVMGHFNLEESTAVDAVRNTNIPILLFHGDDDRFVPFEMSLELKEANPNITFVPVAHAGHGLCYMVEAETYRNAVVSFIKNVLHE